MDALVIEDGVIRMITVVETAEFAAEQGWTIPAAGSSYATGWIVTAEGFEPPVKQPDPSPELVTMRQARIALINAGLDDEAEAALAAMPGADGKRARTEWEYATTLRRDHPLVAGIGLALGLDEAAIDDLFRQAAAIA